MYRLNEDMKSEQIDEAWRREAGGVRDLQQGAVSLTQSLEEVLVSINLPQSSFFFCLCSPASIFSSKEKRSLGDVVSFQ